MSTSLLRGTLLAVSCALVAQAQHPVEPAASIAVEHGSYRTASQAIDSGYDRFVSEIIALTEVPAPPFKEDTRAALFADLARASGFATVEKDEEGNVLALRRGAGGGPMLVLAAHLDTVFPEGTDVTVRRSGTRLSAPGIGDNSLGVAAILAVARALNAAQVRTASDILFVGNVGEEGAGGLRGVRHLFNTGPYRDRVRAFIAVDGAGDGRFITNGGVGSKRYHVTFRGPGGHSYGAFGVVNPAHALAAAMQHLAAVPVPRQPKTTYNVGLLGGGTSVNTIPSSAWMDVDLRSESPDELTTLDRAFHIAMSRGVEDENRVRSIEAGHIELALELLGERPSGHTAQSTTLIRQTTAAIRATGLQPSFGWSSTDANLPMSLGIPAIAIDTGVEGDRAHAPDEWIDVERGPTVNALQRLLLIVMETAGVR